MLFRSTHTFAVCCAPPLEHCFIQSPNSGGVIQSQAIFSDIYPSAKPDLKLIRGGTLRYSAIKPGMGGRQRTGERRRMRGAKGNERGRENREEKREGGDER